MTARRRIGVLHPYWSFWESAVGPDFPENRRALGARAVETLERVVDVAWSETVQPGDDIAALVARVPGDIDALVIASTMASSPGALVEVLDAYPAVPVVLWAAHDGLAVDANISHSGITERGGTVGIPMIGAHLTRTSRPYDVVASDLADLDTIGPAVVAAAAAGVVRRSRLGIVGTPIPGYEWARVPSATLERYGVTAVERPVDALAERLATLPEASADELDRSALDGFALDPDVTEDDLARALRYAAALDGLVADDALDAGTLNCHVPALRLGVGSAPCLALGACTSRGVPWTCTGDVATALAMLLVSSLGAPTLYHEIEALDEVSDEAILANSGEHDARFATADPKRIIVNPWFDRSPGTASAEFTIAAGPASLVGIATHADGTLTAVVAPGRFTDRTSHDSGTANAAFVFGSGPIAEAWRRWSLAGVGHHSCATDRDVSRELEALCRHLGMGFVSV